MRGKLRQIETVNATANGEARKKAPSTDGMSNIPFDNGISNLFQLIYLQILTRKNSKCFSDGLRREVSKENIKYFCSGEIFN